MTARHPVDETERVRMQLAVELRGLLDGLPIGEHFDVHPGADISYCLELLLPRVLRARHPEWEHESLDGIFVARATKTGPNEAKFVGTAILITDQTVTPFELELEAGEGRAVVVRLLHLGEPGSGPLGISGPPANSKDAHMLFSTLLDRIDEMTWSYSLETES